MTEAKSEVVKIRDQQMTAWTLGADGRYHPITLTVQVLGVRQASSIVRP